MWLWMWMKDIRKLLLTFEPPSFVIAKNHGTVTAHKDNHGDMRQRDCLRNMWLCEQKSSESSKGKENSFPGCAFCLVSIGFPNAGIPLLWYCSDRNKQLLVIFHYADLIWGFIVDLETACDSWDINQKNQIKKSTSETLNLGSLR